MKLLNILCFALLFAIATADLKTETEEICKECANKFNISPEEVAKLHTYEYIKDLDAEENVKCFTKCMSEKMGVFEEKGFNVDRLIEISVAHGHGDEKIKANTEKCKDLYKGTLTHDCETSWKLFVCFHQ